MQIQQNFNLKHFNSFHVSAHARYFVEVRDITELQEALAFQRQQKLPFILIGGGSNLLFKEDYPGLVIELNIKGIQRLSEAGQEVLVEAHCGEIWHDFVMHCLEQGYHGLENLSLIPGTVGAAPVQNIGAYGVELSDCFHSLEALEIASGQMRRFTAEDCEFGYRDSVFKGRLRDQFIICRVCFRLSREARVKLSYPALRDALKGLPSEQITPRKVSETVCAIRRSKLPDPDVLGNAGSFFWNPILPHQTFEQLRKQYPDIVGYPNGDQVKVPAAWLIEKAGWKGYKEGDVGVHERHALVLVNHGQASGAELYDLSEKIRASVQDQFGISLWPEVRIIGAP